MVIRIRYSYEKKTFNDFYGNYFETRELLLFRGICIWRVCTGIMLSLCEKHKEQAEVGQRPTLLALRFAKGVLRILRGYLKRFPVEKRKETGYLAVS
jgi:hypothetical protein